MDPLPRADLFAPVVIVEACTTQSSRIFEAGRNRSRRGALKSFGALILTTIKSIPFGLELRTILVARIFGFAFIYFLIFLVFFPTTSDLSTNVRGFSPLSFQLFDGMRFTNADAFIADWGGAKEPASVSNDASVNFPDGDLINQFCVYINSANLLYHHYHCTRTIHSFPFFSHSLDGEPSKTPQRNRSPIRRFFDEVDYNYKAVVRRLNKQITVIQRFDFAREFQQLPSAMVLTNTNRGFQPVPSMHVVPLFNFSACVPQSTIFSINTLFYTFVTLVRISFLTLANPLYRWSISEPRSSYMYTYTPASNESSPLLSSLPREKVGKPFSLLLFVNFAEAAPIKTFRNRLWDGACEPLWTSSSTVMLGPPRVIFIFPNGNSHTLNLGSLREYAFEYLARDCQFYVPMAIQFSAKTNDYGPDLQIAADAQRQQQELQEKGEGSFSGSTSALLASSSSSSGRAPAYFGRTFTIQDCDFVSRSGGGIEIKGPTHNQSFGETAGVLYNVTNNATIIDAVASVWGRTPLHLEISNNRFSVRNVLRIITALPANSSIVILNNLFRDSELFRTVGGETFALSNLLTLTVTPADTLQLVGASYNVRVLVSPHPNDGPLTLLGGSRITIDGNSNVGEVAPETQLTNAPFLNIFIGVFTSRGPLPPSVRSSSPIETIMDGNASISISSNTQSLRYKVSNDTSPYTPHMVCALWVLSDSLRTFGAANVSICANKVEIASSMRLTRLSTALVVTACRQQQQQDGRISPLFSLYMNESSSVALDANVMSIACDSREKSCAVESIASARWYWGISAAVVHSYPESPVFLSGFAQLSVSRNQVFVAANNNGTTSKLSISSDVYSGGIHIEQAVKSIHISTSMSSRILIVGNEASLGSNVTSEGLVYAGLVLISPENATLKLSGNALLSLAENRVVIKDIIKGAVGAYLEFSGNTVLFQMNDDASLQIINNSIMPSSEARCSVLLAVWTIAGGASQISLDDRSLATLTGNHINAVGSTSLKYSNLAVVALWALEMNRHATLSLTHNSFDASEASTVSAVSCATVSSMRFTAFGEAAYFIVALNSARVLSTAKTSESAGVGAIFFTSVALAGSVSLIIANNTVTIHVSGALALVEFTAHTCGIFAVSAREAGDNASLSDQFLLQVSSNKITLRTSVNTTSPSSPNSICGCLSLFTNAVVLQGSSVFLVERNVVEVFGVSGDANLTVGIVALSPSIFSFSDKGEGILVLRDAASMQVIGNELIVSDSNVTEVLCGSVTSFNVPFLMFSGSSAVIVFGNKVHIANHSSARKVSLGSLAASECEILLEKSCVFESSVNRVSIENASTVGEAVSGYLNMLNSNLTAADEVTFACTGNILALSESELLTRGSSGHIGLITTSEKPLNLYLSENAKILLANNTMELMGSFSKSSGAARLHCGYFVVSANSSMRLSFSGASVLSISTNNITLIETDPAVRGDDRLYHATREPIASAVLVGNWELTGADKLPDLTVSDRTKILFHNNTLMTTTARHSLPRETSAANWNTSFSTSVVWGFAAVFIFRDESLLSFSNNVAIHSLHLVRNESDTTAFQTSIEGLNTAARWEVRTQLALSLAVSFTGRASVLFADNTLSIQSAVGSSLVDPKKTQLYLRVNNGTVVAAASTMFICANLNVIESARWVSQRNRLDLSDLITIGDDSAADAMAVESNDPSLDANAISSSVAAFFLRTNNGRFLLRSTIVLIESNEAKIFGFLNANNATNVPVYAVRIVMKAMLVRFFISSSVRTINNVLSFSFLSAGSTKVSAVSWYISASAPIYLRDTLLATVNNKVSCSSPRQQQELLAPSQNLITLPIISPCGHSLSDSRGFDFHFAAPANATGTVCFAWFATNRGDSLVISLGESVFSFASRHRAWPPLLITIPVVAPVCAIREEDLWPISDLKNFIPSQSRTFELVSSTSLSQSVSSQLTLTKAKKITRTRVARTRTISSSSTPAFTLDFQESASQTPTKTTAANPPTIPSPLPVKSSSPITEAPGGAAATQSVGSLTTVAVVMASPVTMLQLDAVGSIMEMAACSEGSLLSGDFSAPADVEGLNVDTVGDNTSLKANNSGTEKNQTSVSRSRNRRAKKWVDRPYDVNNNPLHLFIGPDAGAAERGALLTCLIIMIISFSTVVGHSVFRHWKASKEIDKISGVIDSQREVRFTLSLPCRSTSFFARLPLIGFPSVLLMPAAFALRLLVRSAVRLAVLSPHNESDGYGDAVLATVSFSVAVVFIVHVWYAVSKFCVPKGLACYDVAKQSCSLPRWHQRLEHFAGPSCMWVNASSSTRSLSNNEEKDNENNESPSVSNNPTSSSTRTLRLDGSAERHSFLAVEAWLSRYEKYIGKSRGVSWFTAFQLLTTFILKGLSSAATRSSCLYRNVASFIVVFTLLVLLLALKPRPLPSDAGWYFATISNALLLVCCALNSANAVEEHQAITNAVVILTYTILAVSLVSTVLTIIRLIVNKYPTFFGTSSPETFLVRLDGVQIEATKLEGGNIDTSTAAEFFGFGSLFGASASIGGVAVAGVADHERKSEERNACYADDALECLLLAPAPEDVELDQIEEDSSGDEDGGRRSGYAPPSPSSAIAVHPPTNGSLLSPEEEYAVRGVVEQLALFEARVSAGLLGV